jgi:DNA-directed RNA polymerase specialized sigma24 family protein
MFYSDLVKIETIIISLEELNLADHHKKHLSSLVDSTVHNTIMELVLSKLSSSDRADFIKLYNEDPHNKDLMKFLNTKVDKIEEHIQEAAKKLKDELHEDLREAKTLK